MKAVFVCPMTDSLRAAAVDLRSDSDTIGSLNFHSFTPSGARILPFVPAYFQDYNAQRKPFKNFVRSEVAKGLLRHPSFFLALHDDATDLEAHALSELMIAGGAKDVSMEYRAFMLSSDPEYIAVTASKRAISLTHVITGQEETERIYLPITDADAISVRGAISELDPSGKLPIFTYDLPDSLAHIGEPVNTQSLVHNFLRII